MSKRTQEIVSTHVQVSDVQKPTTHEHKAQQIPLGPRLEAVLEVAYRARRSVLLEGATGIGKSEIVKHVAERLGIATIVLDLSLLEPPDLVGLPRIEDGRTTFAVPRVLPQSGAGILMLEELNRAERYIQQPALQLLTARRLHEYELPPDWVCFAAINPETGDYQVTTLDRALRARFLELNVRPDRASWLAWAQLNRVHSGVVALAQAHERIFDDVPPRSWTYVSQILTAMTPAELEDGILLRDALSGYLPPSWVESLVAARPTWLGKLPFDVRALLCDCSTGSALAAEIRGFRERGETDRLDELTKRLVPLLEGPEAGVLAAKRQLSLASFEGLVTELPGDHRERLQDALGKNPTATSLVDVTALELLQGYAGSAGEKKVLAWTRDPTKQHRVGLAVTAIRSYLEQQSGSADAKRSNAIRTSLGHLLAQVHEKWAMPLVHTMKKLGITPIRPE